MEAEKIDNKIYITEENGEKKEYEVLAYINEQGKNFLVYTDLSESNGAVILCVNSVTETDNEVLLGEVTDEELKLVVEDLKKRLVE